MGAVVGVPLLLTGLIMGLIALFAKADGKTRRAD